MSESKLPTLSRVTAFLVKVESALCGFMIVAMALLVSAEVVCRSFLDFSLLITQEITSYLLIAVAFMGMGVALGKRALFRVEFLFERLPLRLRSIFQLVFDLAALTFAVILDWHLIGLVISSFERGVVAPTTLHTPLYLPQIPMVLGLTTIVLILLSHVWDDIMEISHAVNWKGSEDG